MLNKLIVKNTKTNLIFINYNKTYFIYRHHSQWHLNILTRCGAFNQQLSMILFPQQQKNT